MKVSFQTKGNFDNIEAWLKNTAQQNPSEILNKIASDGVSALSSNTPKTTGETASGWFSEITSDGKSSEIAWKNNAHPESGVNIAKLIDLGHGTGTGGYVAPIPYIEKSMDAVWKDASNKIAEGLVK